MRVGQNPAKSIDHVPLPQKITVATVTYIPHLKGYYSESLEVLKLCLDSLRKNTNLPFDLFVFDNHSCPEVQEFLLYSQDKGLIQFLLLSDKNVGKGGAWNFIFQGAPGEVLAYSDSDVYYYPGWLAQSIKILDAYPKAGMVTARPMRTPEKFYTSTIDWARSDPEVTMENDKFIPWEVYLEHVLSLGTSEEQAREWFSSRSDWRLTRHGVNAYIGAAHFQFTVRKSVMQNFLPFNMDRPMGQVRSLDEHMNDTGYLRLTTCEPLVKHVGNRLGSNREERQTQAKFSNRKRLEDLQFIRKPLLWIYDTIFKLYHE